MDRKTYWYSVIQFQPDVLRGEKINVGLLLHEPSSGKILMKLLDEENIKIKSFVSDSSRLRLYKAHRDFVEYFLLHMNDDQLNINVVGTIQGPNPNEDDFLVRLQEIMPNTFFLTERTFAATKDPESLFKALLEQYIGVQFLRSEDKPISTKSYMRKFFEDKKWIGTKVKQNIKLRPIKEVPNIRFQIDFVFKNGIWNIIQTLPSSEERLNEWFSRTHTMLDSYQDEIKFYVACHPDALGDSTSARQMMKYLCNYDERVHDVMIGRDSFRNLELKIDREAKDISYLGDELVS